MIKRLFSTDVYQRGLNYYRRGRVTGIQKIGTSYYATVRGANAYITTITIDKNHKITKMQCDCKHSKNGASCKHQAALAIALENKGLFSRVQEQSLKSVYEDIVSRCFNYYSIHQEFYRYLVLKLKKEYILNDPKTVLKVIKACKEFAIIPYPVKYKNHVLYYFEDLLIQSIHYSENNQTRVIEWIKENLMEGSMDSIYMLFFNVLQSLDDQMQFDICKDILIKTRDKEVNKCNNLLSILYTSLLKLSVDRGALLEELDSYQQYDFYHVIQIDTMVENGNIDQARRMIQSLVHQKPKFNKSIVEDLNGKIYFYDKDITNYQNYVLSMYQYEGVQKDLTPIKKLKSLYGDDWELSCHDFYQQLYHTMNKTDFAWVLNHMQEYQYMIDHVLHHLSFVELRKFESKIRSYDLDTYLYLYMQCLLKESENYVYKSECQQVCVHLDHMSRFGCSNEGLKEVIMTLQNKYPKKTLLLNILGEYAMKGGL